MAACQTVHPLLDHPGTILEDPSTPTATSEGPEADHRAGEARVRGPGRGASRCLTTLATWDWLWKTSPPLRQAQELHLAAQLKAIFYRPLGLGWWVQLLLFTNPP